MQKRHFFRFWLPLIMYGLLLYFLSAIPVAAVHRPPGIKDVSNIDLIEHLGAYAFFAFLSWRAFHHTKKLSYGAVTLAIIVSIAYGIMNEFHQLFIPGRFFSMVDVAFNSLGSFAVIALKKARTYFYLPPGKAATQCRCCRSSSRKR